jgi:hypothetical protein
MAIFPLYSENASETITVTASTVDIKVDARLVDLNCAGDTLYNVNLQEVPVGTVFTIKSSDLDTNSTGTLGAITVTTKAGKTLIFNGESDKVTLMSLPENEFAIMGSTDGVVFAGNTNVSGTVVS